MGIDWVLLWCDNLANKDTHRLAENYRRGDTVTSVIGSVLAGQNTYTR